MSPSFPLVTSVVRKKPATPDLNRLVWMSRCHESFMCFNVSRSSVTGGFFTVRVRNTQRCVGKRSWILGNCWNITALQSRDLRHWHTGQWRTRQKCLLENQFPLIGINSKFQNTWTGIDTLCIFWKFNGVVIENFNGFSIGTMFIPRNFMRWNFC